MHKHTFDVESDRALVVVTAKEHGKIYELQAGTLTELSYVAEHPPRYSDNEGFFVHAGRGDFYGSGSVRETDDAANLKRYINALVDELSPFISRRHPDAVFIIEPEHLKGMVRRYVFPPRHIPIETIKYGNHVEDGKAKIKKIVLGALQKESKDRKSTQLSSEERKLLAVGT